MTGKRKLSNWLQSYEEYTEGTESPKSFHLWVGLGTVASAMQRKIYMNAGYYEIHSNMYLVLVSPPGRSRKTTALRIGKSLLKGVMDYGQDIYFSTQASSVAALVRQLSGIENKDHQSLTSFSSELGSLLGNKSVEMVDFLVDIYDCNPDWDKQTVSRGLEKIERPWFNLLAATTPQWMGDNLSKTAVEGGFVGRTLFIYDDTRHLVAFPEISERQKQVRKDLIHDLAHIAGLKGEMRLSAAAKECYRAWYEDPQRITQAAGDPRLSGYFERKHVYVLKVAMALHMCQSDSMVLEPEDINNALIALSLVEPGMYKAFSAVGKNIYSNDLERIRDQIGRSTKGLTYKQILSGNIHSVDKDTLDKLLGSLVDMGDIALEQGRVYRLVQPVGSKA